MKAEQVRKLADHKGISLFEAKYLLQREELTGAVDAAETIPDLRDVIFKLILWLS